jgi:hypothetical protein
MGYAEALLPGGFAWPAGLGDIFVAVTAPWIAARVAANDFSRRIRLRIYWVAISNRTRQDGLTDSDLITIPMSTSLSWQAQT